MIKKPKSYHGLDLVGISFSERFNIVEQATQSELEHFIDLLQQKKNLMRKGKDFASTWEQRRKAIPLNAEMINMRKTWRIRYGNKFDKGKMYKFDRSIASYEVKLAPKQGLGQMGSWTVRADLPSNFKPVEKNTILHYSHSDEIGNHYFYNLEYIDSPYLITFKRDDRHLASIVPIE